MDKMEEIRALMFPVEQSEGENLETEEGNTVAEAQPDQEPEADPEHEAVTEPEKVQEEPADEPDGITLPQLATELEIEPEKLYGMMIPLKDQEPVTISELKDIAQSKVADREEVERIKQELQQEQEVFEQKQSELYRNIEQVAPQELVRAQAELVAAQSEKAGIDWLSLESQNPGQAALLRQKLDEKIQIAQHNAGQITERMDAVRNEVMTQRQQAEQQQQAYAMQTLQSLVPEWRDENVYIREREQMVDKLVQAGIPEVDIRALKSPALVKYLRDSLQTVEAITAARPKVKQHKVLTAQAVREKGRGKKQAEKRLIQKATESRDVRVKDEAIRKLMFGS